MSYPEIPAAASLCCDNVTGDDAFCSNSHELGRDAHDLGRAHAPAAEMRILVTGASGFVGSLLTARLRRDGHAVVALGRDPERVRGALAQVRAHDLDEGVEVVRGDALTGAGLTRALDGIEVSYYLIHSMERSTHARSDGFEERERRAAETFASAAASAGVRRIVYLGGPVPRWVRANGETHVRASRHLASREAVEETLLAAVRDSIALRASIVIGARSRSFRLLVRLVERLPVLTLPAWRRFRTQPIDERDVIEMLVAAATARLPRRSLDVGGREALTYEQMLTRIAELMLVNRPAVGFGVNLTGVAARLAAAIAGEDPDLVLPLMEGLQGDLLTADDDAGRLLDVRLHSFDSAVEHALREWEAQESLAAR
jgi:uncharacterized protein YbjT (DUF2867 family)